MKDKVTVLPGEHGQVFLDPSEVQAVIALPAGRSMVIIGGRQIVVCAEASPVANAILGGREGGYDWPSPKPQVLEAPGEEGKRLG